ncbi:MAG: OmpA family protein, partial [Myxococcota bacterium]|nr:OmpA family protein [Myxococcota bacterium]
FGGEATEVKLQLDTDGDGFVDDIDVCPTVPGVESAGGCPDQDGDTVADASDKCPEVPGVPALKGCPDTDFDTLIDIEDRCPKIAGPVENGGCPDTDSDGLVDPDDRCPMIAGDVMYKGCPPPPPAEVIEKFSGVMVGITFEKDSDVIRSSSNAVLDEAFQVLTKYAHLRLLIEGHTSSEGTPEHNLSLSKRRSKAVKKYLVDKGISDGRVETEGFGSQYPVATNENKKGRAQNRRIEFKILRQ